MLTIGLLTICFLLIKIKLVFDTFKDNVGRKEGRKEIFILASIHIHDEIQYNTFSHGDRH